MFQLPYTGWSILGSMSCASQTSQGPPWPTAVTLIIHCSFVSSSSPVSSLIPHSYFLALWPHSSPFLSICQRNSDKDMNTRAYMKRQLILNFSPAWDKRIVFYLNCLFTSTAVFLQVCTCSCSMTHIFPFVAITNCHRYSGLKTIQIYYFIISEVKCKMGLAELKYKCWQSCILSEDSRGNPFYLLHLLNVASIFWPMAPNFMFKAKSIAFSNLCDPLASFL